MRADVEELTENTAHFVAPIVLRVAVLAATRDEIRLVRIGVLAHRREVVGVERRQQPEVGHRYVFVVLLHVQVTQVQRIGVRVMKCDHSSVPMRLPLSLVVPTPGAESDVSPELSTRLGR